ncbi:MAG TPA: HlyD family type I secretion periplasmic adaptor subunit, partial [Gammaproteobacteria bacterium]|nr:HlyD family type I secretion periplasmic adaptor subunit [Gammaproteobacteria bacterium]
GVTTPMAVGAGIVGLFFGVFGAWAAFAPLESAAVARGVISVETQRKTIQHLEGGIVGEILVRDGDEVAADAILVVLDDTQARATLDLLRGRHRSARALEARLIAERDGAAEISFPDQIRDSADADVAELVRAQRNIFTGRRQSIAGQVAIMQQRVAQIQQEIRGLEGQTAAQAEQLALTNEEIESNQKLVDEGLSGKTRLLELQRALAEVTGEHSQSLAAIARAQQNIEETRLEMADLRTNYINEAVQQLGVVQAELLDLGEQIRAAEDVLRRTVIRSPMAGTVVGMQVHTVGGVVAPGQALLDVVPKGDRLIVEAFVDPNDIDVVEVGLEAQVRLTALTQRNLAPLAGHVTTVSADRLTDQRTGASYFLARVELDDDPAEKLDGERLYPGMQAEVMIVTGARTTLDYLSRPLVDSFNRAFREN